MGIELFFSGNLWDMLKERLNDNDILGGGILGMVFGFVFLIVTINKSPDCLPQV